MKKNQKKSHSTVYNIILKKNVEHVKKGTIMNGLSLLDISNFLGENGYPFGYCGNIGGCPVSFSKEVMDNIIVEVEYTEIIRNFRKLKIEELFTK